MLQTHALECADRPRDHEYIRSLPFMSRLILVQPLVSCIHAIRLRRSALHSSLSGELMTTFLNALPSPRKRRHLATSSSPGGGEAPEQEAAQGAAPCRACYGSCARDAARGRLAGDQRLPACNTFGRTARVSLLEAVNHQDHGNAFKVSKK